MDVPKLDSFRMNNIYCNPLKQLISSGLEAWREYNYGAYESKYEVP